MPNSRSGSMQSSNRIRATAWRRVWLQIVISLPGAAAALAQAPAEPGGAGQTQIIQRGPSLFFPIVVVIAMCGLALFAVCRSSRRN